MSSAREGILAAVRASLSDVREGEGPGHAPPAASYSLATGLRSSELPDRLSERIREYRAEVRQVESSEVGATVGGILEAHGARRVAVPACAPDAWLPAGVELLEDSDSLSLVELDGVDGSLTGCAMAIAETGTIVLDAGPDQGRRALSLIPDLHVCVVGVDRILGSVPEAVRALDRDAACRSRPLTFISGPSATSDIELSRVEGVHGPRRLEIVIAS